MGRVLESERSGESGDIERGWDNIGLMYSSTVTVICTFSLCAGQDSLYEIGQVEAGFRRGFYRD